MVGGWCELTWSSHIAELKSVARVNSGAGTEQDVHWTMSTNSLGPSCYSSGPVRQQEVHWGITLQHMWYIVLYQYLHCEVCATALAYIEKSKTEPNQKHIIFLLFVWNCHITIRKLLQYTFSPQLNKITEVRSIHVFNYSPLFTRITSVPIDREITVKITLLSPIAFGMFQHQLELLKSKFHLLKMGETLELIKCKTWVGSFSLEQNKLHPYWLMRAE